MMEAVVAPANVELALRQVERNQGSPGVDGMTVKELSTASHNKGYEKRL
jgi:hypothetical protein